MWVDIKDEKDFDKYKGKLAGKIVLYGDMRDVKPVDKPLFTRDDEAELKKIEEYPIRIGAPGRDIQAYIQQAAVPRKARNVFCRRASRGRASPQP